MAEMVRDQGELVEEIVANVDGAEIDVENGAQHLSTAETLMVISILFFNNHL